jgi:tetratricopeptide (TPR) repeat protein
MKKRCLILLHLFLLFLVCKGETSSISFHKKDQFSNDKSVCSNFFIKQTVLSMFRERKFNELTSFLENCQNNFKKDWRYESQLLDAYDAFRLPAYDPTTEKIFNDWIRQFQNSPVPFLARATYYLSLGLYARGEKWASETTGKQFREMNAYFSKSEQDIDTALKLDFSQIIGYRNLIMINMRNGELVQREQLMKKVVQMYPCCYEVRRYYIRGLTPRWGGSYEKMKRFANDSQQYAAKNPQLRLLKGFVSWDQGRMLELDHQNKPALAAYTKALDCGRCWDFYFDRAGLYLRMDEYRKALDDVNEAIVLSPQSTECYYLRAAVLSAMDNINDALKDLKIANRIWPYDDEGYARYVKKQLLNKGHQLYRKAQYAESISMYSSVVEYFPDYADAYYWRGNAYVQQKSYSNARSDFLKAISVDEHKIDYYIALDGILAVNREWDSIILYWTKFITQDPANARAFRERSGAYYHKGDISAALNDAQKAASLGDKESDKACQMLRERLQR